MTGEEELRAISKVELHRHLDGSVRLGTILELAERYGIDVGARTIDELKMKATVTSPMKDLHASWGSTSSTNTRCAGISTASGKRTSGR